jgi:hypothetical protein
VTAWAMTGWVTAWAATAWGMTGWEVTAWAATEARQGTIKAKAPCTKEWAPALDTHLRRPITVDPPESTTKGCPYPRCSLDTDNTVVTDRAVAAVVVAEQAPLSHSTWRTSQPPAELLHRTNLVNMRCQGVLQAVSPNPRMGTTAEVAVWAAQVAIR